MAGLRTLSATADAALGERQDYAELTQRELHVLHSIADGKSNQQIAFELNVGESTIKVTSPTSCPNSEPPTAPEPSPSASAEATSP